MHVHFGNGMLYGPQQIPVVKPIEVARQPALNANLRGAAFPGLARAAHHFLERERVRVRGSGPASKAAKTASHETNIREVDVSIHDVSDGVSSRLSPQLVRDSYQRIQRRTFRLRQEQSLFERQVRAAGHGVENLANFRWT